MERKPGTLRVLQPVTTIAAHTPSRKNSSLMDDLAQLKVHYVDKVHQALLETGRQGTRAVLTYSALSMVAIGLCVGQISTDSQVDVTGMKVRFSGPVLVVGLAFLVTVVHMYALGMAFHESDLRATIVRIYREVGFTDVSLKDTIASPLEFPSVFTSTFKSARKDPSVLARAMLVLDGVLKLTVVVLPLIVDAVALRASIHTFMWLSWWNLPYAAMVVVTLGYLTHVVKAMLAEG